MENNMSRTEIAPELLDYIAGGAIGFDPEPSGTYTMRCEFSGGFIRVFLYPVL